MSSGEGYAMLSSKFGFDLQLDPNREAQLQLLPQERVQNVKPCWATISDEERVQVLSISLEELRLRGIDLAEKARKQAGALHLDSHSVRARTWSSSMT